VEFPAPAEKRGRGSTVAADVTIGTLPV